MSRTRDDAQLVEVAKLYYEADLSQEEISHKLNLSRSNVSRILKAARERGIVKTIVIDPHHGVNRDTQLEEQLIQKFELTGARVAKVRDPHIAIQQVGMVTSAWVQENLNRMKKVGLGWGRTIESFIRQLPDQDMRKTITLYPLIGGVSATNYASSGDSLIQELAHKINAETRHLYAPALVASPETQQALLKEVSVANMLKAAARVEVALVGIGTYGMNLASAFIEDMQLSEEEKQALEDQEPIGDILGKFFNADGQMVGPPTSLRVISLDVSDLARIPNVVALAAGVEKTPGVAASLKMGVIDFLMVDSQLAEQLLLI